MSEALRFNLQDHVVPYEECSTSIFLNDIPAFAEAELQRLYGHIQSTLPFIRIFKTSRKISTYIAQQGNVTTAVLLFQLRKRKVVVLNQTIQVDPTELRQFVARIFADFPLVGVISFHAVHSDFADFSYPMHRGHAMEDIFIALPDTASEYTASLGKSTRSNLKYYKAKLEKNFADVRFQSYERDQIDDKIVFDLINLSKIRIAAKQINFRIDEQYARCIVELTKRCGVLNVIWVDDELCAGAISYRVGTHQTTEVIAHNEKYNFCSPGLLCFYFAICESVTKGIKTYHMGGGRLAYKVWLAGVQKNMEKVEIYRPYWGKILNIDLFAIRLFQSRLLRLKRWLRHRENCKPVELLLRSRHALQKIIQRR